MLRIAWCSAFDTHLNWIVTSSGWLERAMRAYKHKGQAAKRKAYMDNLRVVYARRPSLQKAIEKL
jgi:hypothetical protein